MELRHVYIVQKFFPPRCPGCDHDFRSPDDFGRWAGNEGSSYVTALQEQAEANPELFGETSVKDGLGQTTNRFHADFIFCQHCGNKTFRIFYGEETTLSRREADRLVDEAGFTAVIPGSAGGRAARPRSTLFLLARADVERLSHAVQGARDHVSDLESDEQGDAFAGLLDPAIEALIPRLKASRALDAAQVRLSERFGNLWVHLGENARQFLATGELLREHLRDVALVEPLTDFSPAISAYSKALEREVLDELFQPARRQLAPEQLPVDAAGGAGTERSLNTMAAYLTGERPIALGEMSHVLKNLGCRLRNQEGNGFASFLRTRVVDLDLFCDHLRFPAGLQKYVMKYRNAAAHVERLTREDCEGARAYLLDEPIQLLLTLERVLRR